MYDDFHVTDRWTGEDLHCEYQAVISAIATRHADAIDIKFIANGRNVWISLPCVAWADYKRRTGHAITDPLAVQIAGHYLKSIVESGYDNGREMYTLTVDETFEHLEAVMAEFKHSLNVPMMPRVEA